MFRFVSCPCFKTKTQIKRKLSFLNMCVCRLTSFMVEELFVFSRSSSTIIDLSRSLFTPGVCQIRALKTGFCLNLATTFFSLSLLSLLTQRFKIFSKYLSSDFEKVSFLFLWVHTESWSWTVCQIKLGLYACVIFSLLVGRLCCILWWWKAALFFFVVACNDSTIQLKWWKMVFRFLFSWFRLV